MWETWQDLLPSWPYATDDFALGVWRRPREEALTKRYLEFNPAGKINWLVFDLDRAVECPWEDVKLPAPNLFVQTRHNGHAHLAYALAASVGTSGASRLAPIRFAADVQYGMTKRLGADRSFINRFTKNPLNGHWRTAWLTPHPFELSDLRGWLDDGDVWRHADTEPATGLGRNVDLFDITRRYAYTRVMQHKRKGYSVEKWQSHLFEFAGGQNLDLSPPLPVSEVRSIAKSVARWTWARFNGEQINERQAERGRRGAEKRWEGHESLAYLKPWIAAGVSRATWFRQQGKLRAASGNR